jgi:hypothetical protein
MLIIKAITILIAAFAISKSYLDFRKKRESPTMFLFWLLVWIASAVIVVYPPLIDTIAQFSRDQTITMGSIIGLAFIFMLYIIYRIYTKASRIEYQQAELIRKLGLKKHLKK